MPKLHKKTPQAVGCQPQAASSTFPTTSYQPPTTRELCERLAIANRAMRCGHIKANGVPCGSPALHDNVYCFFHDRVHNPPYEDGFPALEDANSIQLAIMQVLDALQRRAIDRLAANTLLYGLQTASANLRRVNFEPLALRHPHLDLKPYVELDYPEKLLEEQDEELAPAKEAPEPQR